MSPKDNSDRDTEAARYNRQAQEQWQQGVAPDGLADTPAYLRLPYIKYTERLRELAARSASSVEIGAGTGRFSRYLDSTRGGTIFVDISHTSLMLCRNSLPSSLDASFVLSDVAALPIRSSSVDLVASAGALSYADPRVLDSQLLRILKPGGNLIVVDSLNHNPIFRINRYAHYLRGNRTKATLRRIPTMSRIVALGRHFAHFDLEFFGASSPVLPVARRILGAQRAEEYLSRADRGIPDRLAFKFVLLATGKRQ